MKTISEIIDSVENNKFSEFSDKVKVALEDKMRNNSYLKDKKRELSDLSNMKELFSKINNFKEQENPTY